MSNIHGFLCGGGTEIYAYLNLIKHWSFFELNSIESTESVELVEYYLVEFIFKITKFSILQTLDSVYFNSEKLSKSLSTMAL